MSSDFNSLLPDILTGGSRRRTNVLATTINNSLYNTNLNSQNRLSSHSFGIRSDLPTQIRQSNLIGKRSLPELPIRSQGLGSYLRNVKTRPNNYQHASPISTLSPVNLSTCTSITPGFSSINSTYSLPSVQQIRLPPLRISNGNLTNINVSARPPLLDLGQSKEFAINLLGQKRDTEISGQENQTEKNTRMSHKLQELEKQLLGDEDENATISIVTNGEWSNKIQDLIGPIGKPNSDSPTSSTSSCSSTTASPVLPCPKQALIDAAVDISDGKTVAAAELLMRLQQQVANARGTSEQRLVSYMISAMKPRVSATHFPLMALAVQDKDKEHAASTQMLYDVSPCFQLGFIAANLSILEATTEQGFKKIHVLDFDIGQGGQYKHLLQALAARNKRDKKQSLTITAFTDTFYTTTAELDKLRIVGEGLIALANMVGVCLDFKVRKLNINELTREKLQIGGDEALAVNFAFCLNKLPDESVTTENLRDETLRRVKRMSPEVMTVVEQEINTNTAPLVARVRDAWEYYGLLLDSLDSTLSSDCLERVTIEEGLGRKMANSVACEGRYRTERCEVFGKWRARLSMAGFQLQPASQHIVDSLRVKLNSRTRGNPGFSVNEVLGGIWFGWMGRSLTVASAWS